MAPEFGEKAAAREAYGKTLVELGKNNDFYVLSADLDGSVKVDGFRDAYPERFIQCGIAESNMVGIAAGIAATGKPVFVSTFAMFVTGRAYEQIRNSVGYPHLNVKIVATHAGITVGEDGASHQCNEDIGLMRLIPGMTVLSPCDAVETKKIIKAALDTDGPVYVRMGRSNTPVITSENSPFEIGKGNILAEGKDVSLIATGQMVAEALKARETLASKGISARVVNIHTIKPIDTGILKDCAEKTKTVYTIEEHLTIGGLGDAVSDVLSATVPTRVIRIGIQDVFGTSGSASELLEFYGLTGSHIAEKVIKTIQR